MTSTIKLDAFNGKIKLAIVDRLERDVFNKYLDSINGFGRYNKELRHHECDAIEIVSVIRNLKDNGFTVIGSTEVKAMIASEKDKKEECVKSANVRADFVDNLLKERGLNLYPFQKDGVEWLASHKSTILADEMGLGKTIQALTAATDKKIIVVCPAVAKGVWAREAKRFRPDMKTIILNGRRGFRMPEDGEIVIVNYDILPPFGLTQNMSPVFVGHVPENITIIADEAHSIKNYDAKRTKKFRALSEAIREKNGSVWLLTATPMLNRPNELWTLLQTANVANESFGSFNNFKMHFNAYNGRYGIVWGMPSPEVPNLLKKVCLRRTRREVLPDLPVKTYNEIPVELDLVKDREAIQVADMIENEIEKNGLSDEDLLKSNGILFETMSKVRRLLATAKIDSMLELVEEYEENEQPLVVFSAHRDPIDALSKREGWAVITGDTSPDKRTQIENLFQNGKLKGIACTIKAGGVAITLTHAHIALFVDLEWTPALNSQAEDRICRIGQDRGVIINRMVTNHALDIRINNLLFKKQMLIEKSGL